MERGAPFPCRAGAPPGGTSNRTARKRPPSQCVGIETAVNYVLGIPHSWGALLGEEGLRPCFIRLARHRRVIAGAQSRSGRGNSDCFLCALNQAVDHSAGPGAGRRVCKGPILPGPSKGFRLRPARLLLSSGLPPSRQRNRYGHWLRRIVQRFPQGGFGRRCGLGPAHFCTP